MQPVYMVHTYTSLSLVYNPQLNTGQVALSDAGNDLNIVPAWIQGVTGCNSVVAIVDDGNGNLKHMYIARYIVHLARCEVSCIGSLALKHTADVLTMYMYIKKCAVLRTCFLCAGVEYTHQDLEDNYVSLK